MPLTAQHGQHSSCAKKANVLRTRSKVTACVILRHGVEVCALSAMAVS